MGRILLIDDSAALLALIKAMLEAGGHEVLACDGGQPALAVLGREAIDVVVTDMYMPPPDGFEILQAVRRMARPVPLIVMSTNPLACDVFRAARALGAVAALQKPFTPEQLLAAVDAALASPAYPVSETRLNHTNSPQR